jgi:hypothetical protein
MSKSSRLAREKADAALLKAAQEMRVESLEWVDRLRSDPDSVEILQRKMIEDLQRVYNTPHSVLGRTAGRQRYRELGHFNEVLVRLAFGTHSNFKIEAGLADTPTQRKGAARAAKLQQEQKIHRYYSEVIKPFAMDPFLSFDKETISFVSSSDHHSKKVDPFAMRVLVDFLAWAQPDLNVFNGDIHDFEPFSTHKKFPGHFDMTAAEEVDFCVENIYSPCQSAAPNARHVWVMGNHDYRYVRYVADNGPELAGFDSMNIIDQFRLRELGIDLVCRSNFLAPTVKMRKRDVAENWMIVEGCMVFTHGVFTSKNADEQHWKRFGMSGTNGHLHTPSMSFFSMDSTGPCCWTTSPMMAGHAVGRDYVSMPSLWHMGFVYGTINKRTKEVQQNIITVGESATFGGRTWHITEAERRARREAWSV